MQTAQREVQNAERGYRASVRLDGSAIRQAEEVMAEVKPTSSESEPEAQPSKLVFVLEEKNTVAPDAKDLIEPTRDPTFRFPELCQPT